MVESESGYTVKLKTTSAYKGELFGDADLGCQFCNSDDFIMVEIDGSAGSRKRVQACLECSEPYKNAPKGVYNATAIGYTDGSEYDGY